MNRILSVAFLSGLLALTSCGGNDILTDSGLDPEKFVSVSDNGQTALYRLKNKNGMEVCITNFGGRIVSVMVPDRSGKMQDVVLGFDNIGDYKSHETDFGASIGRYANRIANGRIVIEGEEIQLPRNNFGHCLHGGPQGWQYKIYEAEQIDGKTLKLTLDSPDGDSGFPGNVKATVTFVLTEDNAIDISYSAETDRTTVINMTNHSYFNLSGNPENKITSDILYLNASAYTPVDDTFMTTGEIVPVKDTPMDFTSPKPVGQDIGADFEQLHNGKGYDHNWVLDTDCNIEQVAASVYCPSTGIRLEVFTDEPGIQVYTGNFLDGTLKGKKDVTYSFRTAVCLETQHYPDSPNKSHWPSVELRPGEKYSSRCIYKFSVE